MKYDLEPKHFLPILRKKQTESQFYAQIAILDISRNKTQRMGWKQLDVTLMLIGTSIGINYDPASFNDPCNTVCAFPIDSIGTTGEKIISMIVLKRVKSYLKSRHPDKKIKLDLKGWVSEDKNYREVWRVFYHEV